MEIALAVYMNACSLVCWILVVGKIFDDEQDGGSLQGLFGIAFVPYAYFWGWRYSFQNDLKGMMFGWTIFSFIGVISGMMFASKLASIF